MQKRITLTAMAAVIAGFLSACAQENTYPISGDPVSSDDPVQEMYNPSLIFRGEWR